MPWESQTMDPSVCRLHPGIAVTGCCPACLRDRLAGLQPPSSADLRRCKSFSYARSAVSQLEPQRRSCDLFRQEQPVVIAVPEEYQDQAVQRRMEPSRKSSFGGLLGKKLQQWRRLGKKTKEEMPSPSRHRQHSFRDRDMDSTASWDARSGPMFVDDRLTPAMLSVEEDYIPRSDGQIPVEEDNYYNHNNAVPVPGGCAQTRDYYLDSSSSSRRRRSVDRSTISARNSFSDVVNSELPSRMTTNANARVSPAIAAEFYHAHQSVLVHHHQYCRDWDDFSGSGSFGSAFRANKERVPAANKPNKKGIKGWSIWGLMHKKSSSRKPEADHRSFSSAAAPAVVGDQVEYPWPELRARGYNGQMLRCNSTISARSSFSGGAAMIGGSARRSISGMELQHDAHGSGRTRRDEVLLERTLSTRSSYSRPEHDHPMGGGNYQINRLNHNGVLKDRRSSKSKPGALPSRRSTLGPYSTDPSIPRQ